MKVYSVMSDYGQGYGNPTVRVFWTYQQAFDFAKECAEEEVRQLSDVDAEAIEIEYSYTFDKQHVHQVYNSDEGFYFTIEPQELGKASGFIPQAVRLIERDEDPFEEQMPGDPPILHTMVDLLHVCANQMVGGVYTDSLEDSIQVGTSGNMEPCDVAGLLRDIADGLVKAMRPDLFGSEREGATANA